MKLYICVRAGLHVHLHVPLCCLEGQNLAMPKQTGEALLFSHFFRGGGGGGMSEKEKGKIYLQVGIMGWRVSYCVFSGGVCGCVRGWGVNVEMGFLTILDQM